jgi:hypothetical protein
MRNTIDLDFPPLDPDFPSLDLDFPSFYTFRGLALFYFSSELHGLSPGVEAEAASQI